MTTPVRRSKSELKHDRRHFVGFMAQAIRPRNRLSDSDWADSQRIVTSPQHAAQLDKAAEGALYMRRKRELLDIEIDTKIRALVERTEVDYVLAELGAVYQVQLDSLVVRLNDLHQGDMRKIALIEGVAHELKHEMAETMKRKMEAG